MLRVIRLSSKSRCLQLLMSCAISLTASTAEFRANTTVLNATDTNLLTRSEHSKGGAQPREQYLYGARSER